MKRNYAIARIRKYKHVSQVGYLVNHHLRLVAVANANPAKAHRNETIISKDVFKFLSEIPPGSKRNACPFVDCLFTATRFESSEHSRKWQNSTVEFIKREFGEENIALLVVHNDETTKHIHCIFKPINPRTKKLGAGHWFDGRQKMKAYQDRYFKSVAHLGFVRGDPAKRAEHQTIREWYSSVNKSSDKAAQETKDLKESLDILKEEISNFSLLDVFRPQNFLDRLQPRLLSVLNVGKKILFYQAYNRREETHMRTQQLEQDNLDLRDKLQAITGAENPNWVEIQQMKELLTVDATSTAAPRKDEVVSTRKNIKESSGYLRPAHRP